MQFESAYALAATTPAKILGDAWLTSAEDATHCAQGKRPMTIREAGALADLHGMKLLDVLAV
jgi:hypothetical protein